MNAHRRHWLLFGGATLFTAAGAGMAAAWLLPSSGRTSLAIAGSSAMLALNRDLAHSFQSLYRNTDMLVEAGGSVAGWIALQRGVIDIAAATSTPTASHDDWSTRNLLVARNSIAFVINRDAGIDDLTPTQIRFLFEGRILNWKQLGGTDLTIRLLLRDPESDALAFVEDAVLQHGDFSELAEVIAQGDDALAAVTRTPGAITFITQQEIVPAMHGVNLLKVDGIAFSRISVLTGSYPYIQDFFYLCRSDTGRDGRVLNDFLRFVQGIQAKEIIEQHNLISLY